ncbi:hypothetical protein JCM10212_000055 [Sporobolomyces blumeae]
MAADAPAPRSSHQAPSSHPASSAAESHAARGSPASTAHPTLDPETPNEARGASRTARAGSDSTPFFSPSLLPPASSTSGSTREAGPVLGADLVSPDPPALGGDARQSQGDADDALDETSLTAALVAALVQTRDGPPPPASTAHAQHDAASSSHVAQDVAQFPVGRDGVRRDRDEPEEAFDPDDDEYTGTSRTRSGRRTRRRTASFIGGPTTSSVPSPSSSAVGSNAARANGTGGASNAGGSAKKSGRSRWTLEEDETLIQLVKEEPPLTWTQMGERMGRPGAGCAMRWYNFVRQQVGEAEAEELSNRKRGGDSTAAVESRKAANEPNTNGAGPVQPSEQMQVGSSRTANGNQRSASEDNEGSPVVATAEEVEPPYDGFLLAGHQTVAETTSSNEMPARLPPDESKPGHPYPKTGTIHSNSGPNYLPDVALVKNPPIPFEKNTVIRGRRTHDASSLQRELQAGAEPSATGKAKKVHTCPAENCGAAFKRSEHLKRHYKSVHRGEKPFPCNVQKCGKSFSRKDNLQQHQAMVHGVRALYTYADGTVSVNPPDGDDEPVNITYEPVDITKTARGAARHARQQAKTAKSGSKKSTSPSQSTAGRNVRQRGGSHGRGEKDELDEDAEGEEDDLSGEVGNGSGSPAVENGTQRGPSNTSRAGQGASRSKSSRLPSNVQGLMSASSAANSNFSIGPSSAAKGRAVVTGTASNPSNGLDGSNGFARSASAESNERGGGGARVAMSEARDAIAGDKRTREDYEQEREGSSRSGSGSVSEGSGGANGIDKRLRLTSDVQAHELDPALRVLAQASSALSSGTSPYGSPALPSNSIGPGPTGLHSRMSPLISTALEQGQRYQQNGQGAPLPLRSHFQSQQHHSHHHAQDIPVGATTSTYLPPSMAGYASSNARPFATSSSTVSSSRFSPHPSQHRADSSTNVGEADQSAPGGAGANGDIQLPFSPMHVSGLEP